jgi:hypothetical protein
MREERERERAGRYGAVGVVERERADLPRGKRASASRGGGAKEKLTADG